MYKINQYYLGYIYEKKKNIIQAAKMYSKCNDKKAEPFKSKYKHLLNSLAYIKSALKETSKYKKDTFTQCLDAISSADSYYGSYYKAIGARTIEGISPNRQSR